MKEYTITYTVNIDGEEFEHIETREAQNERDVIGQVHYAWFPAKVTTKSVVEEQ